MFFLSVASSSQRIHRTKKNYDSKRGIVIVLAQRFHVGCLNQCQADERAQKMRDLLRAEEHFSQVKEDLRMKQLQIEDHKKKDQEMQIKYANNYCHVRLLIINQFSVQRCDEL